jgi:diguanylate cyclase (GGDEF)-like protein
MKRRQQAMGGVVFMLLTLFFSILYASIMGSMERKSVQRVSSLADYGAAFIEDRLDASFETLEFLFTLEALFDNFEHIFLALGGTRKHTSLQTHIALLIQGHDLMYFDENGSRIVPVIKNAHAEWLDAMASGTYETSIKGPLPPLNGNGPWMLLFLQAITDKTGDRRGSMAVGLSLESLTHNLFATDEFSVGGRHVFLVNEKNQVLLPPPQHNAPPDASDVPMLRGLPIGELSGNESAVKHSVDGVEYFVAKAPVEGTGWELFVFSPSRYELSFQPILMGAFGFAWLCLCVFVLFMMFQVRRQVHYKVLSEIDHLTGAGNRLAFEKHLESMSGQSRVTLCLILIYVDGLKLINDRLGHQAGDVLLRRVTLLLQRSLRENDAIYRIGGDEFAVIIPGAMYSAAQPLTKRINRQTTLTREKEDLPPIFISHGLAEARDQESFAALFKQADAAMYKNKKMRRETVHRALAQWLDEHPERAERRNSA